MNETLNSQQPDEPPKQAARRGFMKRVAAMLAGAAACGIPGAAGLAVLLDPLQRKSTAATFIPVTTLDALPNDGTPRRFPIIMDKTDAWSKFPATQVGAVYLQKKNGTVEAFNTTCPHLGCSIEAAAGGGFNCPCHGSRFHADGSLVEGSVSPRGLDPLEVDQQSLKDGVVQVRFQNFVTGTHDRIPKP